MTSPPVHHVAGGPPVVADLNAEGVAESLTCVLIARYGVAARAHPPALNVRGSRAEGLEGGDAVGIARSLALPHGRPRLGVATGRDPPGLDVCGREAEAHAGVDTVQVARLLAW